MGKINPYAPKTTHCGNLRICNVTQILREIKLDNLESAILTIMEGLNFDLINFFHFFRAEVYQN